VTITTIRPNATIFASHAYNSSGAQPASTVTSDNSDATYVQGQVDQMYVVLGLGDIAITEPAQRVKSCQIRIRNQRDGAGGTTQDTQVNLRNANDPSLSKVGIFFSTRGTTVIITAAGPKAYTAPGGVAWTQAQVNQLGLTTHWYQVHTGTPNVYQRVIEEYVDVDINNQPVITGAPTVTNFTNNSTPNIAWVYTDADDDPQARLRVKIFDAATVAAGNFDPETSATAWDSGEVAGNADNIDATAANDVPPGSSGGSTGPGAILAGGISGGSRIGRTLKSGVNYTAYVKAAQNWPGPQGQYWWSAWAASAVFQVTYVTPYAPNIISAATIADANAYRASLQIDVPVNLLLYDNSTFETTAGNWVSDANMATPVITGVGHSCGASSLILKSSASGNMVARCNADIIGGPYVDVGKTLTVIGSFKAFSVGRLCSIGARFFDAASVQVGADVYGADITDLTGGAADVNWTQASLVGTVVPAGAVTVRVLARVKSTGAANEVHLLDCVSIHQGTSVVWTPGLGLNNDAGDLLVERGERCLTARGPAENWAHPQVWSCGTAARNPGYGFAWNFNDRLDWMWLDKVIPAAGATPAGMLRWGPTVASSLQPIAFGWWGYPPARDYAFPIVPGQVHVFSIWAWCDTGTFVITPKIEWRNEDETLASTTTGADVTLTTTPQQIVVSGTAPALPATMARGIIANKNADNTRHVFFTRCGFGLGTVPLDGKAPMGGPIQWTPIRFSIDEFANFAPGFDSGQRRVYSDFEIPTGRPVLYRASISYSFSGTTALASPYSAQAVLYGAPPTQTLLRSTTDPMLQVAVNRRKGAAFAILEDAQMFHPLGRDANPVKVRDWVGGEDGQLIVILSTEAQAARLAAITRSGDVMQIQWAQGGRTYALITDRGSDEILSSDIDFCDADGNQTWMRYQVRTLSYVETGAP
jgi:hypothetical protein